MGFARDQSGHVVGQWLLFPGGGVDHRRRLVDQDVGPALGHRVGGDFGGEEVPEGGGAGVLPSLGDGDCEAVGDQVGGRRVVGWAEGDVGPIEAAVGWWVGSLVR